MKIIIIISLLLFPAILFGQKSDCLLVKEGTYKISGQGTGNHIVKRTEKHQIEINESRNYEAKFDITWIDDCTYTLSNKQLIKGDERFKGDKNNVLKVEILDVKAKTILIRCSSNFSDFVSEVEMDIVEKGNDPN